MPKRHIPYGRQWIEEDDIAAVLEVLDSDWLTTGPKVQELEDTFASLVGAKYGVAVSNGTAALHGAMFALNIGPGDEMIVPPLTFAATANCVVFQSGTPVFARRQEIARRYQEEFAKLPGLQTLEVSSEVSHAYHLFVVRLQKDTLKGNRQRVFEALRRRGIGANVHYIPVHLHPFYQQRFGTRPGLCPTAEAAYQEILSLPIFPRMLDSEVDEVISAVRETLEEFS